jgi:Zn-finger nucleic acid-binding protein
MGGKAEMQCPKCRKSMTPLNIAEVSIDECRQCRGIWFDKDELAEIAERIDPDLRWMDLEIWNQEAIISVTAEALQCPRCRKISMQGIHFREPDVGITFCPSCEGIWLGDEDLKAIIDAFRTEAGARSTSEYVKDSLKEASDLFTNPKGFISEWKDLKAVLRMLRYRVFAANPKVRNILEGLQKSLPL